MGSEKFFIYSLIVSIVFHLGVLAGAGMLFPLAQCLSPEPLDLNLVEMSEQKDRGILPEIRLIGEEKRIVPLQQQSDLNQESSVPQIANDPAAQFSDKQTELKSSDEQAMFRYQDMVRQKIEASRRYPEQARLRRQEGVVDIAFEISKDGAAKNIRVMRSCAIAMLDSEALATIQRASPFSAFPKEITQDFITIYVAIVFSLD